MKRSVKVMLVLISVLSICLSWQTKTSAQEQNFSVKAIQPDNSKNKMPSYFDLRVKPGEVKELEVELKNNTRKEMKIAVKANSATTDDNGVIDYGTVTSKLDDTMSHSFTQLVKIDPEITLGPEATKTVKAKVTLPEKEFDGIILGALSFTQKLEEKETQTQNNSNSAAIIGVQLTEKDELVATELKLTNAWAGQSEGHNSVLATLQNSSPKILSSMVVSADVFKEKKQKKPIYHSKKENLNMAPNSTFDFEIPTENKPFTAGNYVLKMIAEVDGEKWDFEKKIELNAEEAKKLNEKTAESTNKQNRYLWVYISGGILLLFVVAMTFWFRSHNKKKPKRKSRKGRKKAKRPNKKPLKPTNAKKGQSNKNKSNDKIM